MPLRTIVILALLLAGAPGAFAAGAPAKSVDAAGALPEAKALPFATGASPVSRFGPDNLFENIDGQATLFLEYGFVQMALRTYRVRPAGALPAGAEAPSVAVRVFDMGTPLQAFGAFSQVRRRNARPAAVGAAGAWARDELLFTEGRFHVSVQLSGTYPAGDREKLLLAAGKAVAARLPQPATLPAELKLLPAKGRVPGSERFLLQNALGLDFLHHALDARYALPGQKEPAQLTIAMLKDAAEAASAYDKLAAQVEDGKAVAPAAGDAAIEGSHPFFGRLVICRKGRYLVLMPQAGEGAGGFVAEVARGLGG